MEHSPKTVEVGCLDHGMPEGAQAIVTELVGEDEEDIHGANLSLYSRWENIQNG